MSTCVRLRPRFPHPTPHPSAALSAKILKAVARPSPAPVLVARLSLPLLPQTNKAQNASLKEKLRDAQAEASTAAASLKTALLEAQQQASTAAAVHNSRQSFSPMLVSSAADVTERSADGGVGLAISPATSGEVAEAAMVIEKGPSPDDVKVEELKAELQAATVAKAKVVPTVRCRKCAN